MPQSSNFAAILIILFSAIKQRQNEEGPAAIKWDRISNLHIQITGVNSMDNKKSKFILQIPTHGRDRLQDGRKSDPSNSPLLSPYRAGHHKSPASGGKLARLSPMKLFEKAHLAKDGETYLIKIKERQGSEHGSHGTSTHMIIERTNSLSLHKEYDIKLSVKTADENNSVEIDLNQLGDLNQMWGDDISSIIEDGWEVVSENSKGDSILRAFSMG